MDRSFKTNRTRTKTLPGVWIMLSASRRRSSGCWRPWGRSWQGSARVWRGGTPSSSGPAWSVGSPSGGTRSLAAMPGTVGEALWSSLTSTVGPPSLSWRWSPGSSRRQSRRWRILTLQIDVVNCSSSRQLTKCSRDTLFWLLGCGRKDWGTSWGWFWKTISMLGLREDQQRQN